jgi:hypothetical protein
MPTDPYSLALVQGQEQSAARGSKGVGKAAQLLFDAAQAGAAPQGFGIFRDQPSGLGDFFGFPGDYNCFVFHGGSSRPLSLQPENNQTITPYSSEAIAEPSV